MSSAITEYIHYYKTNYEKWGINRTNTIKSNGLQTSFSQVKNQLSNKQQMNILLRQAKEIEDAYNNLFFPKQPTEFTQLLNQLAQNTLYEQFGAAAGRFDSNTFDIKGSNLSKQYKQKIEQTQKKIKIQNLKQNATTKDILKTIDDLVQILLEFDTMKSSIVKNRIAKAKQQLNRIKQTIIKDTGIKTNFSTDITTINKLIQQFNRSFQWYNQRGDLFEWLLPLIQLHGLQLTGNELKNAMQSLIGSNNLGADFSTYEIPDFMNIQAIDDEKIDDEKINMKIVNIRNKIDVIIQYAIGQNQYKALNVSAKSVSNEEIKLVNNTNLYYVLLFSENYDFIKHYLNIIVWSNDGGKAPKSQILKANRLVSSLIMQLAAQGYDLNNPADIIIMHNVKKGQIKVYNIKVLINIIKQHILKGDSKYQNLIKNDSNNHYFDEKFTIKQPFKDTVEQRLSFIFNEINNQKITAHLYKTQLQDYFNLLNNNL